MRTVKKQVLVSPKDYISKHLNIINGLFQEQLTKKEIEVLASFMSLSKELTKNSLFNTEARKRVRQELNMIPAGLSHHIKNMRRKGLIYEEEGILKIREFLFPDEEEQGYYFKLTQVEI